MAEHPSHSVHLGQVVSRTAYVGGMRMVAPSFRSREPIHFAPRVCGCLHFLVSTPNKSHRGIDRLTRLICARFRFLIIQRSDPTRTYDNELNLKF